MDDYISRQAAIDSMQRISDSICEQQAVDSLCDLPAAPVREVKRGMWIPVTNGRGGYECDQCHTYSGAYKSGDDYLSNFCPYCGADMRED